MARPLRIEYPGALYHVLNLGNAGERLFSKTGDKETFLEYKGSRRRRAKNEKLSKGAMVRHPL